MIAQLLLTAGFALLIAVAARLSVRRLSEGEDHLGWAWATLPPFLGANALPAVAPADPLSIDGLALIGIGALLMALAATDRQTAWAPDVLTFPLAGLAGAHAMLQLGGPAEAGLGLGIGLFAVIQLLYAAASSRLAALPPPPDLLAFAIGPALLGLGAHFAIALITISALLVVVRLLPPSIAIFHRPEAMQKAAADLGYEGTMGPAVPLLAVIMPVYLIALAFLLRYPDFLL